MRARRLPVVDEYVEDGRAAVYAGNGEVVALSELATGAWGVLNDNWVPLADLASALVVEFGEPEGMNTLTATEATVRELAEHGLVELESARAAPHR